jgi:alpha-L-fucosidase
MYKNSSSSRPGTLSKIILTLLLCFAIHPAFSQVDASKEIPYFLKPYSRMYSKSPRKAALAWYSDARLGMFIHWGVWGKYHAAWAMYYKQIPFEEYKQTAMQVDASGFNAAAIVTLAKESGMKYITFVAKHHDGFSLWDTKATEWNSMHYPMHRDFVAELAKECRLQNIPLFIYYSLGIDWVHPYFIPQQLYSNARPSYSVQPDYFKYSQPADFEKYRQFCMQQLTELCTNYGPVAGFWFDPLGGVLANDSLFKMEEFYDTIHQLQPHALILFKTGATGTEDILVGERELRSISMHYGGNTPEQKRIRELADNAWNKNFKKKAEIAVTSQRNWEWTPKNKCVSDTALWKMLVSAAENNANLLLNFGPKPDGSIPDDVATNFRLLGKMIKQNGYPKLNKKKYLKLRLKGTTTDKQEQQKTAR